MKRYRTLLFDVDGTLLDFKKAEENGLKTLFQKHGYPFDRPMRERYQRINDGLWKAFEEGKITRDTVVNTRFGTLFTELGIEADGVRLEQEYREQLDRGYDRIPGAKELCERLHTRYDLYIVTNGVSKTQYARLTGSGLDGYFKGIFVSEDTGFQKPMPEFFDYCFARIPGFEREKALIVGDSLSSDILGGNRAGIDTCWYNPEGLPNGGAAAVTWEIRSLDELEKIL